MSRAKEVEKLHFSYNVLLKLRGSMKYPIIVHIPSTIAGQMFLRFRSKFTLWTIISAVFTKGWTKWKYRGHHTCMLNILLTSNFLITLIKAIKKNKIAVQNGWDGYRINLSCLSLKVVARSAGGRWKLAWSRRWALPTKWHLRFWDRARAAHKIACEARTARSFASTAS